MPEGHTVHRLARDHSEWFGGQKLAITSPQGRFSDEAKLIDGHTLDHAEACGKHLFYRFKRAPILHIHLGLYGKYRLHENPAADPRGAVRVRMAGKRQTIDLNGPNQCELIDKEAFDEIIARLGPDPLRKDADPDRAWSRITRSRMPIGQLLMDQAVVAGIGNIYRAELLWLHGIHPRVQGDAVEAKQFKAIWRDAVRLMNIGVEHNKLITVDLKKISKPPETLDVRERTYIYKKTHCPKCKTKIQRFTMAGRNVFACPTCQPEP